MNYKVTKIGLINFWYFDEEEFEFSDGKLLLRGENGSGKSVTMQSFIPLILDGNKAPSRLDPFGSKEKRIEDYLLGPSDGIQKDESTGYLYMEVYQEDIDKYITIGMGLRARKGLGTEFWGFCLKDGKRIGKDFHLYKDYGQKILLTKKELRARLGTSNEFVETNRDYKQMVNNLLFGFKELDAYDEFINVLLQLRSSKLSKEYTPTKLMDILSSVLQPLAEDDIHSISEAIEDNNKTREKVETLQRQVKSLTNLLKTYHNYNEIILYHKAVAVSEKKASMKDRETEIKSKEKEILEKENQLNNIESKLISLDQELRENQARLDTINQKDLQKNIAEFDAIKEAIERVTISIKAIESKLENYLEKERKIEEQHKKYEDKVYQDEKELASICDDISSLSSEIKLSDIAIMIGKSLQEEKINFDYLEERIRKYQGKVNQIKQKLEEKEQIENISNQLEEEQLKEQRDQEQKEKELKASRNMLATLLDNFKDKINILLANNQIVKVTQEQKEQLFKWLEEYSQGNYLNAKEHYSAIARYYEATAREEESNIIHKKNIENQELALLKKELSNLQNQKELELEDDCEVIQKFQDENIPFLPFYKAVEFKDDVSEQDKNKLEELLNHMNILNAKIVPKKYLESVKNINTVFLKATNPKRNNLKKYFKPLGNENITNGEIDDILVSISIDFKEDISINPNSYHLDFIVGYPGDKYESKYIGVIKRIEEQKCKIKAKEQEIEDKEKIVANYQNLIESAAKKIEKIQFEEKMFPDNHELESQQSIIHDMELSIKIMDDKNHKLSEKIAFYREQVKFKIIEINKLKDNILIPLNLASYKEALILIDELKKNINDLKIVYHRLNNNKEQKQSNEISLEDVKQEIEYQNEEHSDKSKELHLLQSKKNAIDELLKNPDNQKLIEELKNLYQRKNEIPQEQKKAFEEKGKLQEHLSILKNSVEDDKSKYEKDNIELELRQLVLENEYNLNYVYKKDTPLDLNRVLNDLKDRKNSDINRAFANYNQSYNDYRLDLLEYRLNTKEIFNNNDDLSEQYIKRGLDQSTVEKIMNFAVRQDASCIYQGKVLNIYALENHLKQAIIESESYISEKERHIFEDILLKAIGNKIRDKIESSKEWVSKINEIMKNTQIDSNLSFQLEWKSKSAFTEDELDTKELVRLFKIDAGQLRDEDSKKLRIHFQSKIKKELEYSEKTHESYTSIISKVLDYRNWFEFKLFYQRKSGEKKELTNKVFFVLSGGERAKSMYVPLFASVYAKLLTARSNSLRLIALDEAFAGVDNGNIREMFAILSQLNLDYILTSQSLWGDYDSIKSIAICQLIKDELNKAVAVRHYQWNGQAIELLEHFGDNVRYE